MQNSVRTVTFDSALSPSPALCVQPYKVVVADVWRLAIVIYRHGVLSDTRLYSEAGVCVNVNVCVNVCVNVNGGIGVC